MFKQQSEFPDKQSLKQMMQEVAQRHLKEKKEGMPLLEKVSTFFQESSQTYLLKRLLEDIADDNYGYPRLMGYPVFDGTHDIPKLPEHLIPRARALLYLSMAIKASQKNSDYECLIEIRDNIHNSLGSDSETGDSDIFILSAVFDGNFIQARRGKITGTALFKDVYEALDSFAEDENNNNNFEAR